MTAPQVPSPYEVVGGRTLDALHPVIRRYTSGIPAGSVGRGSGVFDVVGTPRRWLRPVLALLARDGILAPAADRDVPFTVENRSADGPAIESVRTFRFAGGVWMMSDRIGIVGGELVDDLGRSGRLRAVLTVAVRDGALELRSTAVRVRLCSRWFGVPGALAPEVRVLEAWDDAADRQWVRVRLTHPILGELYRYEGRFTYRIDA